jgi:hypothetical protein
MFKGALDNFGGALFWVMSGVKIVRVGVTAKTMITRGLSFSGSRMGY